VDISERDALLLRAAIEFDSRFLYTIKNGTLGLTLYVNAKSPEEAHEIRAKIPVHWEGLYTIILYSKNTQDLETSLYDPKLR